MAQLFRARRKPLRNPVGTVHSYGSLNHLILRRIVHIRADQTFPFPEHSAKQNVCSERCMIDGIRIAECPVSPELLKSSHIVQHSKEPCQINLCLLHLLCLRDPLAQFRHPISVVNFQFYFLIGRIISIRILPECFSDPFTLDFHLRYLLLTFLYFSPVRLEAFSSGLGAVRLFRSLLLVHDGICLAHIVVQIAPGCHIRVDTSRTDGQRKRQFHLR